MDESSLDLMTRWCRGDQQAANVLFRRYADRLIALTRSRLPARLSRRIDPDDVVQSVFRCFFTRARDGRYELVRGGDLWRLLVTITLHKLYHQIGRHKAEKRAVEREELNLGSDAAAAEKHGRLLAARDPSPEETAAVADLLERALCGLSPVQRRMIELRLQGYTLEEIAAETQRCQRTVRRVVQDVKQHLEQLQCAC